MSRSRPSGKAGVGVQGRKALPGDAELYKQLRDRYRDMATSLGFEGHIAWAEAMP